MSNTGFYTHTADSKATGRQNIELFVLEVIGKFCFPAMADQMLQPVEDWF